MRPKSGPRRRAGPPDLEIAALATRQHGVVALRQLLALQLGRRAIERRVAEGRLHRLHVGVYAVGHAAVSRHGAWMAAVLACGPRALLSHRDAAALWGLRDTARTRVDVTAPRSLDGRPGITLHRVRRLHPEDRTSRDGIPVTSVARTLLDLAEVLPAHNLPRVAEQAERLDLLDLRAVERLLARARGRHGLRPLAAVLAGYAAAPATRSELERRFLQLCRQAHLPPPAINVQVAGCEVDAAWRAQRLVVELDGHAYHRTRAAFERDRARDAALQLAGYRVLRLTHRRLQDEPAQALRTVRALLEA